MSATFAKQTIRLTPGLRKTLSRQRRKRNLKANLTKVIPSKIREGWKKAERKSDFVFPATLAAGGALGGGTSTYGYFKFKNRNKRRKKLTKRQRWGVAGGTVGGALTSLPAAMWGGMAAMGEASPTIVYGVPSLLTLAGSAQGSEAFMDSYDNRKAKRRRRKK